VYNELLNMHTKAYHIIGKYKFIFLPQFRSHPFAFAPFFQFSGINHFVRVAPSPLPVPSSFSQLLLNQSTTPLPNSLSSPPAKLGQPNLVRFPISKKRRTIDHPLIRYPIPGNSQRFSIQGQSQSSRDADDVAFRADRQKQQKQRQQQRQAIYPSGPNFPSALLAAADYSSIRQKFRAEGFGQTRKFSNESTS
jgi:hypothetical protein